MLIPVNYEFFLLKQNGCVDSFLITNVRLKLCTRYFLIGDISYRLGINSEKRYRNIKSLNTRHTLCKTSYWEIISWGFC